MSANVNVDVRLAVSDVALRYATAIDTRDWIMFRTCFTEDCVADYGSVGTWNGLYDFAEFMEKIHARCGYTLHRISNQVVSGTDEKPTVRSYVDALVLAADNASGNRSTGWYDDELVLDPEGWKIARRRFTMVYLTADIGAPLATQR